MTWWRSAIAVALVGAIGAATGGVMSPAKADPRQPTAFGLATWTEAQREQTLAAIGQAPAIESLYADFVQPFPADAVNRAHQRGSDVLISWEPWDWQAGAIVDQPGFALRSIIAGDHDAFILNWLQAAQASTLDGTVVIRFAPEMNGDWNPWSAGVNGNTAADYVKAWRHVRDLGRLAGADRLRWMWNPSVAYDGSTPMSTLYPGADQVDLVGLDGFNWGTTRPWSHWLSFDQVFASSIRQLRGIAPGKPWGIAETASAPVGGDKGAWIADAFARARQQGADFFIWFEMAKETDWRLVSSPTGIAAVRAALADRSAWRTLPSDASVGNTVESTHGSTRLRWLLPTTTEIVPGTLVDPQPDVVQDDGLNSTLVVQVLVHGKPKPGVRLDWTRSDPTAKVTAFAAVTDAQGKARAWYFAGRRSVQQVTVSTPDGATHLTATMRRSAEVAPTQGRYVAVYFNAPARFDAQAFRVTVVPQTAPARTYYATLTTWRDGDDHGVSFYGGIQQADCADRGDALHNRICDPARGNREGRLGIFSAWNLSTADGSVRVPQVVHQSTAMTCRGFDGEGEGVQCLAPLDWQPNTPVRWLVERLPGATEGFTRIRVSVAIDGTGPPREFVTMDVPGQPNLSSVSGFNENWGGNEAATCLDVAERTMRLTGLGFRDGSTWVRAASGTAMGGAYAASSTPCQNYAITTTADGLRITSGGIGTWVNLRPILAWSAGSLPRGVGFVDGQQVAQQWQALNLVHLGSGGD